MNHFFFKHFPWVLCDSLSILLSLVGVLACFTIKWKKNMKDKGEVLKQKTEYSLVCIIKKWVSWANSHNSFGSQRRTDVIKTAFATCPFNVLKFRHLPVSFLCTSYCPSVSSSTFFFFSPVYTVMTSKLLSPQLKPLSWVLSPYMQLIQLEIHVSKWFFLPNYSFPCGLYLGKLVPLPPFTSFQPNPWLPSFLLLFPLPSGSPNAPMCESLGTETICLVCAWILSLKKIPAHSRHSIHTTCMNGT